MLKILILILVVYWTWHLSKPNDLLRREITNAKTMKPDIPSTKRRKCVFESVGLHKCSTIEKQHKIPSKQFGKTIESNLLSSSDFVCSKGSRNYLLIASNFILVSYSTIIKLNTMVQYTL